jgi:hypothetical protein
MVPRATNALLAVLTVLLMSVVGLELRPVTKEDTTMRDTPISIDGPRQPATADHGAQAALDRRNAWVQTSLARPLFSPNRRPAAAAAVAAGEAAPSLPRITGILVNGSSRSVIFAAAAGGRPIIATEGTDVNGFKVQAIEANQVTIAGPDGTRVLHPSFDPSRVIPEAPVPPPPAGVPGLPNLRLSPGGMSGIPGLPVAPGPAAR